MELGFLLLNVADDDGLKKRKITVIPTEKMTVMMDIGTGDVFHVRRI
jgi:hypothetical protein